VPDTFQSAVDLEGTGGWRIFWIVFRCLFLLAWIVLLMDMWVGKGRQYGGVPLLILVMACAVVLLLFLLFLLEALEIAYTILRDRHADEFPPEANDLIEKMKGNEHLVYEAREWLATLIVVLITIMTECHELAKLPGYSIFVREYELLWDPLALLLTTLPVLWFAQGLGKTCAKAAPLKILTWWPVRGIAWPLTKVMGWFIRSTGLYLPGNLLGASLEQMISSGEQLTLRPSDEGFFLSGLHRYGFAIHELSILITLKKNGTCAVEEKLVWYLLRYTGNSFSRKLYFDGAQQSAELPLVRGFNCPPVRDRYTIVSDLLDKIWNDPPPKDLTPVDDRWNVTSTKNYDWNSKSHESRLEVKTYDNFPLDKDAFVLTVMQKSVWDGAAFKRQIGQPDFYEMSFEYPCKRYRLEIVPEEGLDVYLANIKASASFRLNPHDDEKRRLDIARDRQSTDGGLHTTLPYPLAGARYRYDWVVEHKPTGNGSQAHHRTRKNEKENPVRRGEDGQNSI
jgi:hypothetical protein